MTSTRTFRLFAAVLIGLFLQSVSAQVVQTFNSSGSYTVPAGVTRLVVDCYGGGGRGGSRSSNGQGGGGGGGAYSRSILTVTPGTNHTVTVGAGSSSGTTPGGDSWFSTATTVMAKGGNSVPDNNSTGATGGTAAASIGTVKFSGGNGGGVGSSTGGGGGSSAGYGGAGGNGAVLTGGTAPAGGGAGGNGGVLGAVGTAGTAPGGGGGGAAKWIFSGAAAGGSGATGRVVVSYYTPGSCMTTTTGINGVADNQCAASAYTSVPMVISGQPTTLGTAPGNARLFNVQLVVSHTFNADMQITLTSPAGTTRNLVLNRFGSGDNLGNPGSCPSALLTLQDGGAALSNTATSNVTGIRAPEQPLAGFTGDPNGVWTLNVCDNAAGDLGIIRYFQLNFCTVPQITAPTTNSPVCSPAAVTLGATVTGSPTPTLLWSGTGTFAPNNTSANVSVTSAATGNYTLTATSSCGSTNAIIPVVVNPQPVITCPGNSSTCLNTPAFALTGGSPAGGAYSGTGVSAGTFDPAVAGVGAHTITYNYTDGNGCTNTPCTFQITVNALPVVTCPSNSAVCIDVPTFALTGGSPVGGTYSGTGVSGGNFDPAVAGAGAHTITYSYTDGNSCTNTCTYQITVNALPVVTCGGPYGPVCIDNGLVALSGSPSGGTWTGTGVSGTDFDPSVSGTGTFGLTYNYTDGNGCSSSCNTSITVNPLPVVTCPADAAACSSDPAFALSGGSPAGGTYSGTGVSGGNFDPALANTGANTITYSYTDGNGCSASCTFTITVTAATPWYEDADNDTYGDPGSMLMDCVPPSGYVADNTDDCPALFGKNGDSCNDANPFTSGDVITACVCAGTPAPCDNWTLAITTDGNGAEISWQVKDANSAFILASGAPVLNNNTVNSSFCVPQGACFELIMNDAGNNGFPGGGWSLTDNNGNRVIDNGGNGGAFAATCTSVPESFCSPVGTDKLIASDCAQEFFGNNDNVYASANPAVSAQWPVSSNADLTDDGYQFWFFNPSGGYSRRIFRNHATSGGFGPADAIRATKLALNNIQTNPLPANTLLNVRVRSRVNGANSDWGPACRLQIAVDPCPSTKLIDTQNHQNFSCGVQREFGGSDKVHCFPVAGANKYRFRFENANEGYLRNIATNTPTLVLNWVTLPLVNGGIYDVSVQASFDGGATYCPLGDVCVVNILNVPAQSGRTMETTEVAALGTERPQVWPNPTADGTFDIRWTVPMEQEGTITLDILDLNGRTLHQERIAVADGLLQAHITPQQVLSSGVYLLRFTTSDTQHMERLVVR